MDMEHYKKLRKLASGGKMDGWYLRSEEIFKGDPPETEEEFIKYVAFAYSWMPTIPRYNKIRNWEQRKLDIQDLCAGDEGIREKLVSHLARSVNNSIVGASKILYFICPDTVPIIDSNVVLAWRQVFFKGNLRNKASCDVARLPYNFGGYGNTDSDRKANIKLYIEYWDNMNQWVDNCHKNVTLRHIETKLYLYGKTIAERKKA